MGSMEQRLFIAGLSVTQIMCLCKSNILRVAKGSNQKYKKLDIKKNINILEVVYTTPHTIHSNEGEKAKNAVSNEPFQSFACSLFCINPSIQN